MHELWVHRFGRSLGKDAWQHMSGSITDAVIQYAWDSNMDVWQARDLINLIRTTTIAFCTAGVEQGYWFRIQEEMTRTGKVMVH